MRRKSLVPLGMVEDVVSKVIVPDGTRLISRHMGTVETFTPRWWRLDRWVFWLLTKRAKGTVTVTRLEGGKIVYESVRVIEVGA